MVYFRSQQGHPLFYNLGISCPDKFAFASSSIQPFEQYSLYSLIILLEHSAIEGNTIIAVMASQLFVELVDQAVQDQVPVPLDPRTHPFERRPILFPARFTLQYTLTLSAICTSFVDILAMSHGTFDVTEVQFLIPGRPPSLLRGSPGADSPLFKRYYEATKTACALLSGFGFPRLQYHFCALLYYTASEKDWALPNLFTRVYTRLEVVWIPKPLRCRYILVASNGDSSTVCARSHCCTDAPLYPSSCAWRLQALPSSHGRLLCICPALRPRPAAYPCLNR